MRPRCFGASAWSPYHHRWSPEPPRTPILICGLKMPSTWQRRARCLCHPRATGGLRRLRRAPPAGRAPGGSPGHRSRSELSTPRPESLRAPWAARVGIEEKMPGEGSALQPMRPVAVHGSAGNVRPAGPMPAWGAGPGQFGLRDSRALPNAPGAPPSARRSAEDVPPGGPTAQLAPHPEDEVETSVRVKESQVAAPSDHGRARGAQPERKGEAAGESCQAGSGGPGVRPAWTAVPSKGLTTCTVP